MNPMPPEMRAGFDAMSELMERNGWTNAGTQEADPRWGVGEPGTLVWGRDREGQLWILLVNGGKASTDQFEPITIEEWRERWPHSHPPEFAEKNRSRVIESRARLRGVERRDEDVRTVGEAPLVISPVEVIDVYDGDSFRAALPVGVLLRQLEGHWQERIRLAHVNAPELHELNGPAARTALIDWITSNGVMRTSGFTLLCWGRDQYGRLVADLRAPDGKLASEHMLEVPGSKVMGLSAMLGRKEVHDGQART